MPELISDQADLIIYNSAGSHVGNRLPPTSPAIYHEAAEFSEHSLFYDFLREHTPQSIVDLPHVGSGFFGLASHRARLLGEFEAAQKFSVQGIALARRVPEPFRAGFVHQAIWELAMLQAQTGQTLRAEKTMAGAQKEIEKRPNTSQQLNIKDRLAVQNKRYAGYVALSFLQARQGKFAMARKSGQRAAGVNVADSVRPSQDYFGERVVNMYGRRNINYLSDPRGLTPEEEEKYYVGIKVDSPDFSYSHEIPLTPEERETYQSVIDPWYLPEASEVEEAYSHDRLGELLDRYYRSGTVDERYEILTQEYIQSLAEIIKRRLAATHTEAAQTLRMLEVGAGDARLSGFLAQALRKMEVQVQVVACDLRSDRTQQVFPVRKQDYMHALEEVDPHLVVSSWMPWKSDWTPSFRVRPNLKGYVLVGDTVKCGTSASWAKQDEGFTAENLDDTNSLREVVHPYAPYIQHGITRAFWRQ